MPEELQLTRDPKPVIRGAASQGQIPQLTRDEPGSMWSALWKGLKQGAGDILYGGAQIGARMAQAPEIGQTAPAMGPGAVSQIDQATRQREQAYQADPMRAAHPIAAGLGRFGGNVATTAPLAAIPGGAATIPGRLGAAALTGAVAAPLTQPVTGPGSFAAQKLRQAGEGAIGGGIGGAMGEALSSTLGKAIAGNSPQAVDQLLTRAYRRVIRPSRSGITTAPQLTSQDQRMLTAVDQIIDNKDTLKLTHERTGEEISGQLPRTVRQFAEAIDQRKQAIFDQYDKMAQQAGNAGVRIDLRPAEAAARQVASGFTQRVAAGNVASQATQLADNLAREGTASPGETQNLIQYLNKTLEGYWKSHPGEAVGMSRAILPTVQALRDSLDQAISGAVGPGYQALRNQYGALRSIEKDVTASFQREANKLPGGIGGLLADIAGSAEFMRGLIMHNPEALARAGGLKAAKYLVTYMNGPNRAISRLFDLRSRSAASPERAAIGGAIRGYAPGVGALAGAQAARVGQPSPFGGTVVAVRKRQPEKQPDLGSLVGP